MMPTSDGSQAFKNPLTSPFFWLKFGDYQPCFLKKNNLQYTSQSEHKVFKLVRTVWFPLSNVVICLLNAGRIQFNFILLFHIQTHTQAERKIMEAKRKSLLEGSSENSLIASLQDQLAELETRKRRPYGTVHAVRIVYISFSCSSHAAVFFFRPF